MISTISVAAIALLSHTAHAQISTTCRAAGDACTVSSNTMGTCTTSPNSMTQLTCTAVAQPSTNTCTQEQAQCSINGVRGTCQYGSACPDLQPGQNCIALAVLRCVATSAPPMQTCTVGQQCTTSEGKIGACMEVMLPCPAGMFCATVLTKQCVVTPPQPVVCARDTVGKDCRAEGGAAGKCAFGCPTPNTQCLVAQSYCAPSTVQPVQQCASQSDVGKECKTEQGAGKCDFGCPVPGAMCIRAQAFCSVTTPPQPADQCPTQNEVGKDCKAPSGAAGKCAFGCPPVNGRDVVCIRAQGYCAEPSVTPAQCATQNEVGKDCKSQNGAAGKCAFGCPPVDGREVQCVRAQGYCSVSSMMMPPPPPPNTCQKENDPCALNGVRGTCQYGSACPNAKPGEVCIALAVLQCKVQQEQPTDICVTDKDAGKLCKVNGGQGTCAFGCPPVDGREVQCIRAQAYCQPQTPLPPVINPFTACRGKQEKDACQFDMKTSGICQYGSACPPDAQVCTAVALLKCVASDVQPTLPTKPIDDEQNALSERCIEANKKCLLPDKSVGLCSKELKCATATDSNDDSSAASMMLALAVTLIAAVATLL